MCIFDPMKHALWIGTLAVTFPATVLPAAPPATTEVRTPLTVESNESTRAQLDDARLQGDAVRRAWDAERPEIAGLVAEKRAGQYRLIVTLTKAEGWYEPAGKGRLQWHDPGASESHLRVVVLDGGDGRTVPGLDVYATVDNGPEQRLPFGWYPLLNGYGANVHASITGTHDVRVRIARAEFHRHDPYNGDRFSEETFATFTGLSPTGSSPDAAPGLSAIEEEHSDQAGAEGGGVGRAVRAMWQQATSGAEQLTGDYRIEEAVEFAEAYWFFERDRLVYKTEVEASSARNCHVEIAPRDAATGRFLPAIPMTVTVWTENGRELGTRTEPLMWHPWLYHYGANWRVPLSGRHYRVRATFAAPTWRRYGRASGNRFAQGADVEFREVKIKSGEK